MDQGVSVLSTSNCSNPQAYYYLFFKVEAASKLRCNLCVNKRFTSLKMYDDHMASKNHRKKELRKDTSGVWVCQACDLTLNSQTEWVRVF